MSALHISLAAEHILTIAGISMSNAMLTSMVASVFIVVLFYLGARTVSVYPRSLFASAFEAISEFMLGLIEQVTLDRRKAEQFFPLLMTFFIFILVNNWIGLLPGIGSITITTAEGSVPLFRGANADLNTTLALAIISVITTHAFAIRQLGLFSHLKKYISLNPIMLFVGLLELVSEFSKMISFSFRLFGNIFAGEVLLVVIGFLMPAIAPLPFFGLELFVGLVQALVFTMLTLVFLEIATSAHGEQAHASVEEKNQSHIPLTTTDTVEPLVHSVS